jgi:phage terminase large subunit-like protein
LGRIADELGTPLMGWQQYVADVGLEVDPESGRLAYKEVIVSVMRQNGKTTLVHSAMDERCLMWGREQRVAYTAQTGKDARSKFKDDFLPILDRSPLKQLVKRPYLSDGNTALLWKNGSRISVLDNTPAAGHGKTLDLAIIDEAFSDQDNQREQALLPTMATRENAQIWNVSTAGTQASTYLLRKVEIGRAAVNAGSVEGIAYFEWSIPEDEDVDDPDIHELRMPAYGVTIHSGYIAHARRTMTDGDFRRAIGNQWTETDERVIPAEWWRAVCSHEVRVAEPLFAVDARADHSSACVLKADAAGNVELVAVREGVEWLRTAVPEHVPKGIRLLVDAYGPVAHIADDWERQSFNVQRCDALTVRKACGRFYDAVADRKIQVRSDERLDQAVTNAVRKQTADTWSWHRDQPGGDLLVAMSLAYATAVTENVVTPFAWS